MICSLKKSRLIRELYSWTNFFKGSAHLFMYMFSLIRRFCPVNEAVCGFNVALGFTWRSCGWLQPGVCSEDEGIEGSLLRCRAPAAAVSNNLVGRLVVKLNMPLLKWNTLSGAQMMLLLLIWPLHLFHVEAVLLTHYWVAHAAMVVWFRNSIIPSCAWNLVSFVMEKWEQGKYFKCCLMCIVVLTHS